MNEVLRSYARRLEEDLKKIDLFSSAGKNRYEWSLMMRLLADVHHFTEVLSALDGVDGPGSALEVCVNNIRIKDKRTYQLPPKVSAPAAPKPPPPPPSKSGFGYNFSKILRSQE
jgi:vacuolar protein sorting-associated protein 54